MKQHSAEWFQARLGVCTASRIFDIIPGKRGGFLASRKAYMLELLAERITGVQLEFYLSKAMEWGTNTEPLARSAYEAITTNIVTEVGFFKHKSIPSLGASPDGHVGEHGVLEIKCPTQTTHLDVMSTGIINPRYLYQMQTQMMCTGRHFAHYVDYDPRMPEFAQFYMVTVKEDPAMQLEIEANVRKFVAELDHLEEKIRENKTT